MSDPRKPGSRVKVTLKNGHEYEGTVERWGRAEVRLVEPLCIFPTWSVESVEPVR